ncbi:hypothetical protein [Gaiella sp.]|uniref:hypothetical protein n=1 Tax=Gaiella sp. TaxID=2663207 RepID=UPI003982EDF6
MKRFLVAAIAALSLVLTAAPAQAAETVYTGQWLCDDRGTIMPLGGIELQLWRRGSPDFLPVEWVGGKDDVQFANPDGTFSLRATNSEDNHFIRMALRDAAGVRLKDWIGTDDWSVDTGGYRNNVAEQNLGGLLFSTPGQSHKCAIWRGLHLAHRDFRDLMGFNPPSGGLLIQADAPGETPLTMYTEIWWPSGYVTGYNGGGDDTITRHEFGHVIRHGYDGDSGHFLGDVVAHTYARSHSPCLRSGSLAYAFNEGWSEYWAHEYGAPPMCADSPADDYTVEGNVAAALADIEARCYGGNRAAMVNVLRSNPGVIHSFQQFRELVFCPLPLLLVPLPPTPAPAPVALTPAQRADLARAQVRGVNGQLGELRADLRAAVRAAATPLRCPRTPCNAALQRALLPAVLRSEIALAELVRNSVDDGDTAKEQAGMAKLPYQQLLALQRAKERATSIQAARISADGIRDALKAGRSVFAKDKSAMTKRLRTQLASRLAAFRKAQRGAKGAPGLILDQAIADRLRKVPTRPFPNPEPPPPPWTPIPILPPPGPPQPGLQVSTLTLACPANGKAGVYATGGTLTPPLAGAAIELHVTPPNGAEAVQKLTTNGSGAYATSLVMQTAGTWTMFARFAGDAKTQPDDSPSCQTTIT